VKTWFDFRPPNVDLGSRRREAPIKIPWFFRGILHLDDSRRLH
jgi:hypothetical protein